MPRPVAALDADVLVPILSCDLLLTAFETGLYEPAVSTEDRHVIAAASSAEATIVVTNDKRLRIETAQADIGLEAMNAYLCPMRVSRCPTDPALAHGWPTPTRRSRPCARHPSDKCRTGPIRAAPGDTG